MWTIGEVKSIGKAAFKANYWKCVLVALILGVVSGGATYTIKNRGDYDPREVANAIFSGLSNKRPALT